MHEIYNISACSLLYSYIRDALFIIGGYNNKNFSSKELQIIMLDKNDVLKNNLDKYNIYYFKNFKNRYSSSCAIFNNIFVIFGGYD